MKNQYSIHELMTLFADGELPEADEQFLFDAIASNAELQAEFKQTLLVHKLLNEVPAAIPSEECDAQLFAKAGFGENKKKRASIFFLNMRTLGSAAAILCILGAYSFFVNFIEHNNVAQISIIDVPVNKSNQSGNTDKNISVIHNHHNNLQKKQIHHKSVFMDHNAKKSFMVSTDFSKKSIEQDMTMTTDNVTMNTKSANNVETPIISDKSIPLYTNNILTHSPVNQSGQQVLQMSESHNTQRFSSQYFIEARGAMSVNASTPNVSLAGMVKLQEKTWIGLAAGRDNMVNLGNNSVTDNEGDLFGASTNKGATRNTETVSETIPTIQHWFGAVIERRLGNIVDGIEPTTRFTLGGAESGPFGKLGIGVTMRFSPQFVGTIGIENTGLLYRSSVDNSWKSVTTVGGLCSFAIEF